MLDVHEVKSGKRFIYKSRLRRGALDGARQGRDLLCFKIPSISRRSPFKFTSIS